MKLLVTWHSGKLINSWSFYFLHVLIKFWLLIPEVSLLTVKVYNHFTLKSEISIWFQVLTFPSAVGLLCFMPIKLIVSYKNYVVAEKPRNCCQTPKISLSISFCCEMIQGCEERIENEHQSCAYHIILKFEFSNLPVIVSPFGLSFFHCIATITSFSVFLP